MNSFNKTYDLIAKTAFKFHNSMNVKEGSISYRFSLLPVWRWRARPQPPPGPTVPSHAPWQATRWNTQWMVQLTNVYNVDVDHTETRSEWYGWQMFTMWMLTTLKHAVDGTVDKCLHWGCRVFVDYTEIAVDGMVDKCLQWGCWVFVEYTEIAVDGGVDKCLQCGCWPPVPKSVSDYSNTIWIVL